MNLRKGSVFIGVALSLFGLSSQAQAHWCDDLWASSYNIVVRPDSDTSPKNVYVQNNMGYQLINFKLTASGGVTLTAPTTLKVSGTLLPGEKGTWKISAGSPAKIEDITFSVSFGNSGQSACYPTKGAKAVMVVKADGTLYPASPPALPGLDSPANPGCTGDMIQGQSLQDQAIADFEDVNAGLDKLTQHYCAGRGSWDTRSGKTVTTFCPSATAAPSCPTTTPTSGSGSKYDYMHLWGAGELVIRKSALGTRAVAVRAGLICGVNDADISFAGYTLFALGYLGDDTTAKTFIQSKVTAGGDLGTIAKAALYLMGDTAQKADVQAGAKASSAFVKAACAAALGIVDKDDAIVTSALLPLVSWTEPDGGDGGKGLFAGHLLELVAFDCRGWVSKGVGSGAVTFYGETATGGGGSPGTGGVVGAGGVVGSGGVSGAGGANTGKDASVGSDAKPSSGGVSGSGGVVGPGGATGVGGAGSGGKAGSGGATGTSSAGGVVGAGGKAGSGGAVGVGGAAGSGAAVGVGGSSAVSSGGAPGNGGNTGESGGAGPGTALGSGGAGSGGDSTPVASQSSGCSCSFGGRAPVASTFYALALVGLALFFARRRRR